MQRIRGTLISSMVVGLALVTSGAAFAEDESQPAASKPAASRPAPDHNLKVHTQGHTSLHVSGRAGIVTPSQERVMVMQRALADRGLYDGKIDGIAGPETQSALREFQNRNGLTPTGELNASTADALGMNGEKQPVAGTDPTPQVQAPGSVQRHTQPALEDSSANVQLSSLSVDQAKELQERLQLLGFYRGEIDGRPGPATRAALQQYFQHQAELAARGVISNSAIGMFGTEVHDVPAQ